MNNKYIDALASIEITKKIIPINIKISIVKTKIGIRTCLIKTCTSPLTFLISSDEFFFK